MSRPFIPIKVRYESKVIKNESGCWGWSGSINQAGYGALNSGGHFGRPLRAHRVSWELHFGPIPAGMLVCHHCDNRICSRPDHLFLGTAKANSMDMSRKGRQIFQRDPSRAARGSKSRSRLTEEQVIEMRRRRKAGTGLRELAEAYKMAQSGISAICNGKNWRHTPI